MDKGTRDIIIVGGVLVGGYLLLKSGLLDNILGGGGVSGAGSLGGGAGGGGGTTESTPTGGITSSALGNDTYPNQPTAETGNLTAPITYPEQPTGIGQAVNYLTSSGQLKMAGSATVGNTNVLDIAGTAKNFWYAIAGAPPAPLQKAPLNLKDVSQGLLSAIGGLKGTGTTTISTKGTILGSGMVNSTLGGTLAAMASPITGTQGSWTSPLITQNTPASITNTQPNTNFMLVGSQILPSQAYGGLSASQKAVATPYSVGTSKTTSTTSKTTTSSIGGAVAALSGKK